MSNPRAFLKINRQNPHKKPAAERVLDFNEFETMLAREELENQAERCMDCGIPFCHSFGCPVQNRIPDWNSLIHKQQWRHALEMLHSTINFPEVTGRVCPAPCESACTLAINQQPVTIRHIELQIVERGWAEGWIRPEIPPFRSGKRVAVIGSGPAGLSAAQQLARAGHEVIVFEKSDRIGGILRYGIPDFKLEKWILDRRLDQMKKEGVVFETQVDAGVDISSGYLSRTFDAIVIATGTAVSRDLNIPGRELNGIHYAMEYLTCQNRQNAGDDLSGAPELTARDKHVVVIGGGDTGSDCVGTAHRQGARSVTQLELLPQPPQERVADNPWPVWPLVMRTSSSHEEGCDRQWSISTKAFHGKDGMVEIIRCARLDWQEANGNGRPRFREIEGSEFELDAGLVLLAMGFLHVEHGALVNGFGLELDARGNIRTSAGLMTSVNGVFAAGDCATGASLVVRAFSQGRRAAAAVDRFLMG